MALAGAIAAFCVAPLLKFANPVALAISGVVFGLGLLGFYNVRVVPGVKPWAGNVANVVLGLGGFGIALTIVFACQTSIAVESYCAGVQARLIDADRRRVPIGKGKDVFQALQCRPLEVAPPAPMPIATRPARSVGRVAQP